MIEINLFTHRETEFDVSIVSRHLNLFKTLLFQTSPRTSCLSSEHSSSSLKGVFFRFSPPATFTPSHKNSRESLSLQTLSQKSIPSRDNIEGEETND